MSEKWLVNCPKCNGKGKVEYIPIPPKTEAEIEATRRLFQRKK